MDTTCLVSRPCTANQLSSAAFRRWTARLAPALDQYGLRYSDGTFPAHRKLWEWCYIAESLRNHGVLRPGSRGLGFAVGQEPLPAMFASLGCEILGTDLQTERAAAAGWVSTSQHAENLESLCIAALCEPEKFRKRVEFRFLDMNDIPADLAWPNSQFDFLWSSCSIEHLGSIRKAQEFVLNSIRCVRPGGIVVHTTEFNVTSNADTVAEGETVLFRRCDIEELAKVLTAAGNLINVDFEMGDLPNDEYVDLPPYQSNPHLKLKLFEFVATSFGLTIIRAAPHSTQIELPIKNAPRCGGLRGGGEIVIVDRVWKRARQGTMSIPRSSGALAPNPPRDFAVPRLRTSSTLRASLPMALRQQFLGDLPPCARTFGRGTVEGNWVLRPEIQAKPLPLDT